MADQAVKDILENWGLPQLIPLFEAEEIDEHSFNLLNVQEINKIITKTGPRLKFLEKHTLYISSNKENFEINSASYNSDQIILELDDQLPPETNCVTKIVPLDQRINTLIFGEDANFQKNGLFTVRSLEEVLNADPEGNIILKTRKHIDNHARRIITKIVIQYLMNVFKNDNGRIPTYAFVEASEEIVKLFPHEKKEIYFIPYKKKTIVSPKLLSRGRLWSRYVNVNQSHKKLEPRESTVQSLPTEEIELPKNNDLVNGYMNFLTNCFEPWPKIEELWQLTYEERKNILKSDSIYHYYNRFPALQQPQGYLLLLQDFSKQYPDKGNYMYESWPELCDAINRLAIQKKVLITDDATDSNILALKRIPHLFPPTTINYYVY